MRYLPHLTALSVYCALYTAQVGGTFGGAVVGGVAFAYVPLVGTHFLFVPLGLAQCLVLLMHDRILRPSKLSPALSEPLKPTST